MSDKHQHVAEWVTQAQAGDQNAFTDLFNHFYPSALRRANQFNHCYTGGVTAEDMVQEAFMKAFKNLEKFRGDSQFQTWFTSILVNTCLAAGRKKKVDPESPESALEDDEGTPLPARYISPVPNQERELASRELTSEIYARLDDHERTILNLRDREGHSMEEISEALGKTVAGVKSELLRSRIHFRKIHDRLVPPREQRAMAHAA